MISITRAPRRRLRSLPALLLALFGAAAFFTAAPPPEAHAWATYKFEINTCDVYLAGTNAKIEVKLDGSLYDSNWQDMNDLISDDFERGSTESRQIHSSYELGMIKGFWVRRNTWGLGDAWCLSSIKLTQNGDPYYKYAINFEVYDFVPRTFAWNKWVPANTPIHLTAYTT